MMARNGMRCVAFLVLIVGLVVSARAAETLPARTAFDDYIAKPDPSYAWELIDTIPGQGCTTYVIDMKSQTWRTREECDRPLWQHWLIVVKPDRVTSNKAFVLVGGGANGGKPPKSADPFTIAMAQDTNSVVAELKMIPNQPLVFFGDGQKRKEDDLIAYCWVKFMKTGDPTWLPRFPMVKSVVRAMDTIQSFMATAAGGKVAIEQFVVAGGSKRGWTTWLTGVADPRVVAIVPIVIDVLNVKNSMRHHHDAYGFWSEAVGDYVHHKIMEMQDTPQYAALLKLVDPYSYRHRLTMPKYIVNAAGDEFFLPDSSQFYFDQLVGEKYLRYVPNAKHSLAGSDARESIEAFYESVVKGTPRPKFRWTMEKDGSIRVMTKDKPRAVHLWQATDPEARDFRLDKIGPAYKSSDLSPTDDGVYIGRVSPPTKGFTAYFVELVYKSGGKHPFKFTTPVRVVPDVLPFAKQQ
jgi:PhoPQ-activated pathogenicity-related protein